MVRCIYPMLHSVPSKQHYFDRKLYFKIRRTMEKVSEEGCVYGSVRDRKLYLKIRRQIIFDGRVT